MSARADGRGPVIDFMDEFGRLMKTKDLDNKEVLSMYDTFADNYEKDLGDIDFSAADITAKYLHKHAQRFDMPKDCRIIDVAAGTGRAGELLTHKYGYSNIDAIDPSEAMLAKAREKKIYTNIYVGKVGDGHTMPIADEMYDAAVVSGALVPGHLKYDAFLDILRVLKPGGIVVNTMREEFTWNSQECEIRVPFSQWVVQGRWKIIEWTIPDTPYFCGKDGLVHVYRKS